MGLIVSHVLVVRGSVHHGVSLPRLPKSVPKALFSLVFIRVYSCPFVVQVNGYFSLFRNRGPPPDVSRGQGRERMSILFHF